MKYLFIIVAFLILSFKPKEKVHTVELNTKYGTIKLKLYNETPKHRDNFLKLTNEKFYDGVLFHRVIKDFMIQAGDPDSKNAKPGVMLGSGDVGYTIPAEFNEKFYHKKGVLAAARDNNPTKASSGCQFYIVEGRKFTDDELNNLEKQMKRTFTPEQREVYKTIGGTPHLDMGYTVFGEVISGLNFVDSIANVKTGVGDRPLEEIKINYIKEGKMMKVKLN
jgi:cyclophilin family peptidyl-prolyl cis-trans isomerase